MQVIRLAKGHTIALRNGPFDGDVSSACEAIPAFAVRFAVA